MFYMYVPTFIIPNHSQNQLQSCFYIPVPTPIIDFTGGNYSMLLPGERKYSINVETGPQMILADGSEKKQATRQGRRQGKLPDEDYRPTSARQSKFKKICQQPQNRNIIPNVIRLVVTFIQRPSKSQKILKKLLQRQNHPQYSSSKRYYLYHTMIKNKMHNYVNINSLIQMTRLYPSEYGLYSQMTRIMINYFMRGDVIVSFLVSKRMDATKRKLHMKIQRDIREMLQKILRC